MTLHTVDFASQRSSQLDGMSQAACQVEQDNTYPWNQAIRYKACPFHCVCDIYISSLCLSLYLLSACLSASRCLCLAGSACLQILAPADLDMPSFQAGSSAASRQTRQLPHSLKLPHDLFLAPSVTLSSRACVVSEVSSASGAPWQAPIDPGLPENSLQYFANFVCSHNAKGFRAALNR